MRRTEYALRIAVVVLFVVLYFVKGRDVIWLFAAMFQLIHTKADQILAEIRQPKEDE